MKDRDLIIEKIKKLLRLKHGGTTDEIATALRLAQELAEKHGIDLGSINPDEQSVRDKPISHDDAVCGSRVSFESLYASLICDSFFKVRVFKTVNDQRSKYVLRFVGEEWDIQIAIYVYRFLCGHFRREWKSKRGRLRKRQSFMWGMYNGLSQKLRERQPEQTEPGIIRADRALARRDQYIAEHFGELKSTSVEPDSDSAQARYRGWLAGRATEIRSGMNGGSDKNSEIMPAGETKLIA